MSAGSQHGAPERLALLERDAELAVIAAVIRDAECGSGSVAVVEAAAGLGKSALLGDTAMRASAAGLLVLRASGHQLERAFGWGVARALFEGLLRDTPQGLVGVLDGPVAPARAVLLGDPGGVAGSAASDAGFGILHALYWLVVRLGERRPTVLVVDDAHWADVPSLRFLAHLQPRIADLPVGVVIGARPADGDAERVLGVVAADPGTRMLRLRPLSAVAVERLVRDRWPSASPEVCRRCGQLTGGNPLQLRELLRAVDGPGGTIEVDDVGDAAAVAARRLERFVCNRLAALPAPAAVLAEAVAVFEDGVPVPLAAALAQVDPTAAGVAVDELVRADVLAPRDPLGFYHPLLRAAVYGAIPLRRRGELHARAARLCTDAGAPVERVGAHLLLSPSGGDAEVVETLRSAAGRALEAATPDSAVQYLERALREPPPPVTRAAVLAELGHAEAVAGRSGAVQHLEAAMRLVGAGIPRAELLLAFARALHHDGRLGEACEAFRRGLDELCVAGEERSELRVALEGGYLNAALFTPARAGGRARARSCAAGAGLRADVRGRACVVEQGADDAAVGGRRSGGGAGDRPAAGRRRPPERR